ncbi:MAG: hypothetical protein M3211_02150 [Actinomycetota bacterium]|nr:hypothetical protein [Actinomycetota bacterium]
MAIARFKDLCVDTTCGEELGRFWAAALGLAFEPEQERSGRVAGTLTGPTPQHRVWMNVVPEARSVKQRVHLDVHTDSVQTLVDLGATVVDVRPGWTVLADPEGGELCAFVREQVPDHRLYEVSIDCADPAAVASFWGDVFGTPAQHDADHGWWSVESVPGAPFESMVFDAVPEPKTVKNRIHWDVDADDLQPLLDRGATVVRARGGDIRWTVLADPEGNEFCAFTD